MLDPVTVSVQQGNQLGTPVQEEGYWSSISSASGFRAKAVLDTPSSVTSFPEEVIRDQQARSVTDVIKNDPSVVQAESPLWYDRVMVRGFYLSTDAIITTCPNVPTAIHKQYKLADNIIHLFVRNVSYANLHSLW